MKKLLALLLTLILVGCVNVNVSTDDGEVEETEMADEEITEEDDEEATEEDDEATEEETVDDEEVTEEESVDDEENIGCGGPDCDNQMLIGSYYNLLEEGDLDTAYAMKYEPSVSFKTFKGWYSNVLSADLRDYEEIGDQKYQFIIDLVEDGGVENSYLVVMVVRDGLLDTLSSTNMTIKSGTEVYVKVFSDGDDLYVKKDGEEIFVDSLRVDKEYPVQGQTLKDYYLTESGKFLAYQVMVWEAMYVNVFDIENEKFIFEEFGVGHYGFTDDEDYFYVCTEAGMVGDMIRVYNVPSFSQKRDLKPTEPNMMVMDCYGYDPYGNSYAYGLTTDWQKEIDQTYYFDTNTIE